MTKRLYRKKMRALKQYCAEASACSCFLLWHKTRCRRGAGFSVRQHADWSLETFRPHKRYSSFQSSVTYWGYEYSYIANDSHYIENDLVCIQFFIFLLWDTRKKFVRNYQAIGPHCPTAGKLQFFPQKLNLKHSWSSALFNGPTSKH